MSKVEILIYKLESCGYSTHATFLLDKYKVKHTVINVTWDDMEQYKNDDSQTFPIIYLIVNNEKFFIGGCTDFCIF